MGSIIYILGFNHQLMQVGVAKELDFYLVK